MENNPKALPESEVLKLFEKMMVRSLVLFCISVLLSILTSEVSNGSFHIV
jgi:hypothetical protein